LKDRWKKCSEERIIKSICKWLRVFVNYKSCEYSMGLEIELLNYIFDKPLLKEEQLDEIH
jgi:hypothetical protein